MVDGRRYFDELKRRAKKSRVYKKYQLVGLDIAQLLNDEKHKSLYIKLAKIGNGERLLRLAKEIKEKKGIKNKGAYFMSCLLAHRRARENKKKFNQLPNNHGK